VERIEDGRLSRPHPGEKHAERRRPRDAAENRPRGSRQLRFRHGAPVFKAILSIPISEIIFPLWADKPCNTIGLILEAIAQISPWPSENPQTHGVDGGINQPSRQRCATFFG
jgi:hypothetical protein